MKLSTILSVSLLSLSATATPVPEPETSPNPPTHSLTLLSRADKWCNFHPSVSQSQGCDYDRWNGNRKYTVGVGERFGVSCWSVGKVVSGNNKWDYIPGWGCWISAHWTNNGCEDGVRNPC